ncbi:MAG TPA: hypothetical protein VLU06_12445 [Thermoanaerobaculia bacterium]|nr:hypothetical protein [Thermoanaerobaculia bacterium]
MIRRIPAACLFAAAIGAVFFLVATAAEGKAGAAAKPLTPVFSEAVAFDVSPPLYRLAQEQHFRKAPFAPSAEPIEIRPERGPVVKDLGYSGDGALQGADGKRISQTAPTIPSPLLAFEGLSNQDNFNVFGGRVNPPDPDGAVGPNHYVEMINLVFGVYDKAGNLLLGPVDTGSLWAGFAVPDCTDPSGDPIVLYDKLEDRWLLTQFTTRGPYYNCVAVSMTGDPTGAYFRYAFLTTTNDEPFFPDYPKYGNWKKTYVLTSRDFGDYGSYGISVYALEKNKMIAGNPNARMVRFYLDSDLVPINLMGDGLLPADIDGTRQPAEDAPIPIVGTQDDDGPYGATFDALNIWELTIKWQFNPVASLSLAAQLPVAGFDSIFPCTPTSRDCLPQPGITNPAQYLDILSYRQRPTWRLAYRNFKNYESMVTNQAVEALPGVAGVRWYEIRRTNGVYSLNQQGTYAPADGVHRWMGSIAQDWQGNMALGYSVVNGVDVFPGIRYTGRLAGDPLGQMTLGEGVIINGSGVQRTTNSRWGDYTSMNVDPTDECTFWYVNEYYTLAGQLSSTAGWQTRIGSFKLPGCVPEQ